MDPEAWSAPDTWPPGLEAVEAAIAGDRNVLGDILTLGHRRLIAFYRGMGLDRGASEDLASEVCEGVVRGLPRLREPVAFEAWFWSIARNRFRTHLRKKGRIDRELEYPDPTDPVDAAIEREDHARVRRAMESLSDRDRELLWLREVEGLSHETIAGRLGLKAGAIRVAVLRARRRLEEHYARLDDG